MGYGDLIVLYPNPYSIYLRGTISRSTSRAEGGYDTFTALLVVLGAQLCCMAIDWRAQGLIRLSDTNCYSFLGVLYFEALLDPFDKRLWVLYTTPPPQYCVCHNYTFLDRYADHKVAFRKSTQLRYLSHGRRSRRWLKLRWFLAKSLVSSVFHLRIHCQELPIDSRQHGHDSPSTDGNNIIIVSVMTA